MTYKYLPGLDSLRFFAAFFVIISHANQSIIKLGIGIPCTLSPIFEKGGDAVDFFFTLSGFLITYLLLQEKETTGSISLKNFYLRRVFRIWPLYFIVLAIGFTFFTLIYPLIFKETFLDSTYGMACCCSSSFYLIMQQKTMPSACSTPCGRSALRSSSICFGRL